MPRRHCQSKGGSMSKEYRELEKKIKAATTSEELKRLEKSMDNLFYTGFLSAKELGRLDTLIMERLALL
jgi:hypothetical protein